MVFMAIEAIVSFESPQDRETVLSSLRLSEARMSPFSGPMAWV